MDAERWLAGRLAAAPPSLRGRVEAALADRDPQIPLREALERRAERLVEEAAHGPPTRETALTLLAADALITLACEYDCTFDVEAVSGR